MKGDTPDSDRPTDVTSTGADWAVVLSRKKYLFIYDTQTSWSVPLPRDGSLVIGRSTKCDIRLNDTSVSRKHAELVMEDGLARVHDLGSQNGTRVNGERVQGSSSLAPGDLLTISEVTIVLHDSAERAQQHFIEFSGLRTRLDHEFERALRYNREFAVVSLVVGPEVKDKWRFESTLAGALRALDTATWAGPNELFVLLPESSCKEVTEAARRILDVACKVCPDARAGYGLCPSEAVDVDALLAGARTAALNAEKGEIAAAGLRFRNIEVGGRTVVVADPAMARLYALVDRVAACDLPILVYGETGTGKEVVATAIHARSHRRDGPLITLNCAAIQENLLESELFGHSRGAFTGATEDKAGLLEAASCGTMFLDEVGELSPSAQAKLLRVLDTKRVTRVGEVRERVIDIRLIAATNRDLAEEVSAKRFREDLYYRLRGAALCIPPLRERKQEVLPLAEIFLADACERLGRPAMVISTQAARWLAAYAWPGNVRELRNHMDYVASAFPDPVLESRHLDECLDAAGLPVASEARRPPDQAEHPELSPGPSEADFRPLAEEIEELERNRIEAALQCAGGKHKLAAQYIGMPLRTFANKVKKYNLAGHGKEE